jgi:tetratricopeptide (TPR) repeat protein
MRFAIEQGSPALLERESPRAEGRPAMRSTTLKFATILGLLVCGALMSGCAGDAKGDGGAMQASLAASSAPPVPTAVPEPTLAPVDAATARAAWREGVALYGNGDYTAASDKLKTAVAGAPQDAYRRYLLGLALWKSGDRDGAATSLLESANLDATRPKTWINLARVRNDLGDRTGALEAAEKGVALDGASADALHQKGRALMELNRPDEALVALTAARGLDAANGYIANTLGLLLIQLGRPGDALEPLEAAKAALPHVAYVRNNLGVAYERTGKSDEAKSEYLAAVDAGDVGGKAMRSLVRLGAKDTTQPVDDPVTAAVREPAE